MNLNRRTWNRYISRLRKVNSKAADLVQAYINKNGVEDRDKLIQYVNAVVMKYGTASASVACEMYDEIAAAQKVNVPAAEPSALPEYGEVAKAVNGTLKQSPAGSLVSGAASRMVKQMGADTTLQNAKRDGAYFAWVPNGDTCPYCMALAALGWQRAGKKTLSGDHAEHIHAHCDCTYAIDLKGDMEIEGYDPDEYLKQIRDMTGDDTLENDDIIKMAGKARRVKGHKNEGLDYLNTMRREQYKANGDKIRAQKRAAYAKRQSDISDEEYIAKKIKSGEWGSRINREKQLPHMEKTRDQGKSYLFDSEDPQKIFDQYHGKGYLERDRKGRRTNKEIILLDHDVGVDYNSGEKTNMVKIHHSKNRTHIVAIRRDK